MKNFAVSIIMKFLLAISNCRTNYLNDNRIANKNITTNKHYKLKDYIFTPVLTNTFCQQPIYLIYRSSKFCFYQPLFVIN